MTPEWPEFRTWTGMRVANAGETVVVALATTLTRAVLSRHGIVWHGV